mmetsp:Transcript_9992/g.21344  ORF Transcript_9992/g.21344 Transcript_9992/m.21344 type:complete len:271 (-) Transcript_9992:443-1255(-)|eukprot:CAMPEP_0202901222 /NCGR_PEP_ID=MMETSP1392-20130828/14063_1 /ASSEMBLY_ACC=CAM_ASM_000868 /TAXON_ID=225041 /ORGANISM="Chlamydomonas chlamydogama, Strain SAG 11-48b" /LENGTH=270 /DNA_ID=CAMNT_0049587753 /DNA_START=130 /DNA_END=942 /DNA_ORIENTATION=+
MLQQALRRIVSPVTAGTLQSQAASLSSHNSLQHAFSQRRQDEDQAGAGPSVPSFHVPSLLSSFSTFSSQNDSVDSQQSVQSKAGLNLGMYSKKPGMSGKAMMNSFGSFAPLMKPSFAASTLLTPSTNITRTMSTLISRARGPLSPVKGLGLGQAQSRVPAMQTRSFGSEGEIVGTAFLLTTDMMFWSGLIGAVVFRRNLIVMLLCTEIVMLACNMNFLFASAYLNDMTGVIMSITITTIAACETAIGLALCVTYFHIRSATDVEALNLLK